MWILFAAGSAVFAGLTSVFAKVGTENINSNLLTAIRTAVVLIFSWIMVIITGQLDSLSAITPTELLFICLSGGATGASWLCYFKALQLGNVNKVVPIDKLSTVLTMVMAVIFFGEPFGIFSAIGMALIVVGTLLMIAKKADTEEKSKAWLIYALLSAVFASLTAILAKMGMNNVPSNLATAIRTIVVLIIAWGIVIGKGRLPEIRAINRKGWIFTLVSGLFTGLSWLCYYRAIKDGIASVVVPIDKLSIVITVAVSAIFLHEKISLKQLLGLILLVGGTMVLLIK
ncbi:MAG: EamA family transporter [Ruminiclostridium sp.]